LAKISDGDRVRHRMGDLGYFDDMGRVWFCGRKSQRVQTAAGEMYTVPCESIFNTHPDVYRTALVGIGEPGAQLPVLCVELEPGVPSSENDRIRGELIELGKNFDHTRSIGEILFHPGFPVDIRHNAKIGRSKLAEWSVSRVAR
jgi:acyl-coenzyme A synthetase/AMP-(fatty) acid ligase